MAKEVGVILSEARTSSGICQLFKEAENIVEEGMLVLVEAKKYRILGRIEEIIPFNEFFLPGDAWSEVRREGLHVPLDVARQYKVAKLEFLGVLTKKGLKEVVAPPEPSDKVLLIDIEKESEKIFGVRPGDSGYVWFGSIVGYQEAPVPLNVENITMHIGIFGTTGSGKSFDTGYLIELLSEIPYKDENWEGMLTIPTIIVDANGDYLDYVNYYIRNQEFGAFDKVYRFVFPNSRVLFQINPKLGIVKKVTFNLDPFLPRELAELIVTYYTGGLLNELQVAALETVLKELIEVHEFTPTQIFLKYRRKLFELIDTKVTEGEIHYQTATAVKRAINKFKDDVIDRNIISYEPELSSEFIDDITSNPSFVIIDFSPDGAPETPLQIKQLVISYLTKLLYQKFTNYKTTGDERYLILAIEEAQNYCPNLSTYPIGYSLARENLALIATQGRKFGISLCLITQRPSFVDPIVLSMLNTFFIHRISPEDISYVKKVTGGLPPSLERKLTTLGRGRVIISGQMNVLGFPLLVEVRRRKVSHTMGETKVCYNLARFFKNKP